MKLGFVGMGFVGGNTAKVFGEKFGVIAYDKFKEPYTSEENLEKMLGEASLIFLSVPTPMNSKGEIDKSFLYDSLDALTRRYDGNSESPVVVIRSTAVPGTTKELSTKYPFPFVFNPEFLKERTAYEDMKNTSRVVIGADEKGLHRKVRDVYAEIFPEAKYVFTDTKTAEMIKYSANVFLASQISVANEISKICEVFGVDYNEVRRAILLDGRIGRNISVPGPDGLRGFGGKCFPKDLNALIHASSEKGYDPLLLKEVWELNKRVREKEDWKDIPGAVSENKDFG